MSTLKKQRFGHGLALLFCLICLASMPAWAAQTPQPAYIVPTVTAPIWSNDALYLSFERDETLCRKAYGKDWQRQCQVWLGEYGSEPNGLAITPALNGVWIWDSPTTLRFTPTKPWASNEAYAVNLEGLSLPSRAILSTKKLSFKTSPLSARIEPGKIWIDPDAKSEHAASFTMHFTAPLDENQRKALQQHPILNKEAGLELAPEEWIWLEDNTKAVLNVRLLELPSESTTITLTLPNIYALYRQDNQWHVGKDAAIQQLKVPGTKDVLTVHRAYTEAYENKALQMEQHLVLRFTRRVDPNELLTALTVLELPEKRDSENLEPSDWTSGGIQHSDLEKARELKPKLVRLPGESADILRFHLDATPGRYVLWHVPSGFGALKGSNDGLSKAAAGIAQIGSLRPRLHLLQAGNILMLKGSRTLTLVSEKLDSIRWSAHRFMDDRLALPFIESLDNPYLSTTTLDAETVVTQGEISTLSPFSKPADATYASSPVFSSLDVSRFMTQANGKLAPGVVLLRFTGIKDGKEVASHARLLMLTDLGLIVKKLPDGTREAFVSSIDKATPLARVHVQILGYNGLPVAEARTDATGRAKFPSLDGLTREKKPAAIVASYTTAEGTDKIWLSLLDAERNVHVSRFSTAGRQNNPDSLSAYVFAQRGIFRPGETLHFGVLLRGNDWNLAPANLPLAATLYDPAGRKLTQQRFMAQDGVHALSWDMAEEAPTGRYRVTVSTPTSDNDEGLILGTGETQVDMFQPDTLGMKTAVVVKKAQGTAPMTVPSSLQGWLVAPDAKSQVTTALEIQLRNLFGLPAQGRRVRGFMTMSRAFLQFAGFEDYTFQDTQPFFDASANAVQRPLNEAVTDNMGKALLPLDLTQWNLGTLQCRILAEGFEPSGGRSVSEESRFIVSPLRFMLGYKPTEAAANMTFIPKKAKAALEFLAIGPDLQTLDPGPLEFSVAKRRYITSLVTNTQGQYRYDETPLDMEFARSEHRVSSDEPYLWQVPTDTAGEFLLTVKAAKGTLHEGTVLARIPFTVAGDDDIRPALMDAENLPSAKLRLRTDKSEYASGDTAKLFISSPYDGVALISLERDHVAAYRWVKVPSGNSVHTLTLPEDFEGRGYINVLMGRSPSSETIFLQSHGVAVAPVTVDITKRKLPLAITAPASVTPGQNLHWKVENTNKTPVKAVLFAVDEGLLQLTRFATPDPLAYLLLDRALEVDTAQFFDRLMPDHLNIMKRLSAFGGGLAMSKESAHNPFKRKLEPPMAWWGGVVEIGPEGLDVQIPVPDYYNGTVRLMAVGSNLFTVGSTQAQSIVQADHILTPQVPTMAAPNDQFEGGIGIANTTDKPVTLQIHAEADPENTAELHIQGLAQSITLDAYAEGHLSFQVQVGETPGNANLLFTATAPDGSVQNRSASLSIRPAVLPRHEQRMGMSTGSQTLPHARQLLPFDAQGSATVSVTPLPMLRGALHYLERYPHDCVEQIISKAFPLAMLTAMPHMTETLRTQSGLATETASDTTLKKAREALTRAFRPYQGMSLWTDTYNTDLLLTAYAADYILTLREAELALPSNLTPSIFNTLQEDINRRPESLHDLRALSYAAWVLARAGYVVAHQLEFYEAYITSANHLPPSDVFNTLMAGTYAAMHMQQDAERHLAKVANALPANWNTGSSMLDLPAQYGLHGAVLARHFPKQFQQSIPLLQEWLVEGLNKGHATLGASMAARALLSMAESYQEAFPLKEISLTCTEQDEAFNASNQKGQWLEGMLIADAPGCTSYELTAPKGQTLFWETQSYGYDKTLPKEPLEQGLRVERTLSDHEGFPYADAIQIPQGDVVRVDIDVALRSAGNAQVAVVDLLPGGFELVLEHKDNTYSTQDIRIDRREDRFVVYIDATNEPTRISYHMRAVNKGHFILPPTHAEGLYDTSLQSHTVAGQVEVVQP